MTGEKMWDEPNRILPSDSWTATVIETQSPVMVNRTPEEMENEIRWLPIGDRVGSICIHHDVAAVNR